MSDTGIELARERPFPVLALRTMAELAGEDDTWRISLSQDLHREPLLITLWREGLDSIDDVWDPDEFLDGVDGAVRALSTVAQGAFHVQDNQIDALDDMAAAGSVTLPSGWSLRDARLELWLISMIGTLSTSAQLRLLDSDLPRQKGPVPEIETEASWHAKAKAAGLTWNVTTGDYSHMGT